MRGSKIATILAIGFGFVLTACSSYADPGSYGTQQYAQYGGYSGPYGAPQSGSPYGYAVPQPVPGPGYAYPVVPAPVYEYPAWGYRSAPPPGFPPPSGVLGFGGGYPGRGDGLTRRQYSRAQARAQEFCRQKTVEYTQSGAGNSNKKRERFFSNCLDREGF